MPIASISQCAECRAVVNIHWPACLVCQAILPPAPEAAASTQLHRGSQGPAKKPLAPILPGWLVTYQDKAWKLCGGAEDRAHGTVQACHWEVGRWTVCLTDGQQVPLWTIRAVGKTDKEGRVLSVWTVREHGYDGRKQEAAA